MNSELYKRRAAARKDKGKANNSVERKTLDHYSHRG